jgi:cytochrome c oxidase subunit 1
MYSELVARTQFAFLFVGFTIFTMSLSRIGILGMRRRIADYDPALGFETWNTIATLAGYLVFFSFVLMVLNVVFNWRYGTVASPNPWHSRGLEWQIASPPPEFNYSELPHVVGNPYDYGLEGSVYAEVAPQDRADIGGDDSGDISGPIIPKAAPQPAIGD